MVATQDGDLYIRSHGSRQLQKPAGEPDDIEGFIRDLRWGEPERHFPRLGTQVTAAYVSPEGRSHLYRGLVARMTIFYRYTDGALLWDCDPSQLFPAACPNVDDVDVDVVCARLLGLQHSIDRTPYRAVRGVPPGHVTSIDQNGQHQMHRVDKFKELPGYRDVSLWGAAGEYYDRLRDSTARALSHCDKVAVFLSGGLDSGLIAEIARQHCETVCVHFTSSIIPGFSEERRAAESVARHLNLPLDTVDIDELIREGGGLLSLDGIGLAPYTGTFFHPWRKMADWAAERGIGTVITGGMADDLFAAHRSDALWEAISGRHPRGLAAGITEVLALPRVRTVAGAIRESWAARRRALESQRYREIMRFMAPALSEAAIHRAFACTVEEIPCDIESLSSRAVHESVWRTINHETIHETILDHYLWGPRNLSAVSPFHDYELVCYALSLGASHRYLFEAGQRLEKVTARLAGVGRLPKEIVRRSLRAPYAAMGEVYIRNNIAKVSERLDRKALVAQLDMVSPTVLDSLRSGAPASSFAMSLTALLGVEAWLRSLEGQSNDRRATDCTSKN